MSKVGCPIRRSMDQSLFAAPHGFSQRITSFFACACQGIHQMPLRHFIVLIANAHHLASVSKTKADRATFYNPATSRCHRRVRQVCFIGVTPSDPLAACLKTSFSRSNPGSRGQATIINQTVRGIPKEHQQQPTRVTDFLPPLAPPSCPVG